VVNGAAPERLLDSYEAERRPVGAEVVARTRAASENYGREQRQPPDRLADTQINVSYRHAGWVADDGIGFDSALPAAGDRAPDGGGLRRRNVGFSYPARHRTRSAGISTRGPIRRWHAEVRRLGAIGCAEAQQFAARRCHHGCRGSGGAGIAVPPGIAVYYDVEHRFAAAYGSRPAVLLIRPDGYIGWRGHFCAEPGLNSYLRQVFVPAAIGALPPI